MSTVVVTWRDSAFGAQAKGIVDSNMTKKMPDPTRRHTLRTSVTAGIVLTGSVYVSRRSSAASLRTQIEEPVKLSVLTDVLRSTGSQVCISQAAKLEALPGLEGHYDLHLRSAGLNAEQAQQIATAIHAVASYAGFTLRFFSMSFNPGVGDIGTIALAASLPATVTEVGLVGCDVADEGGEALLNWASTATALRLICVEDNRLSRDLRERYLALGRLQSGLLVVV